MALAIACGKAGSGAEEKAKEAGDDVARGATKEASVGNGGSPFYSVTSYRRDAKGCSENGQAISPAPAFVTSRQGQGAIGAYVAFLACPDKSRARCEDIDHFPLQTKTQDGWREETRSWSGYSEDGKWQCLLLKTVFTVTIRGASLRLDTRDYELGLRLDTEAECNDSALEAHESKLQCASRTVLSAKLAD
jgi:hypothetical protein